MYSVHGPQTGEKFVFVFFSNNGDVEVFNRWSELIKFEKELKVSRKSISMFLRNGLIYPPYTIYSNVIMLPVGSSIEVDIKNGIYKWHNNFNYLDKHSREDSEPDSSHLLSLMSDSFKHLALEERKIYVMQSAGKDSAAMLLGLKEAGVNASCITYEANYRDKESGPAKKIAESLGFSHQTLEADYEKEFELLMKYQKNAFGITGDFSLLPYIAANGTLIDEDSIVIDGLGNDMYMGYVSPKLERILMKLSLPSLKKFEPSIDFKDERFSYAKSCFFLHPYERLFPGTRLSTPEIESFLGTAYTDENASYFDELYKNLDKDDFRVQVRARLCDSTQFQMKGELSCDAFGNEIYFPFSNEKLVDYYFNLPIQSRYDKPNVQNKTLLRKMIGELISEDEFFKTKSGFRYNMPEFISVNFSNIVQEIISCKLYDATIVENWLNKFSTNLSNYVVASKIYILLVMASWYNSHNFDLVDEHIADKFDWQNFS